MAAKIESDRAAVEAVAGPINSSKGQAEHTARALGGLGVEVASERMRGVVEKIEEAESMRAALQGALVKAHFIVLSAIHGTLGPGARSSAPDSSANAGAAGGGSGPLPNDPLTPAAPSSDGENTPEGSDCVSSPELQYRNGDQIEPWEAVPQPPAILQFEDEDDEFDRLMRKSDDLSDGTKNVADSLDNIVKGLERGPAPSELRTITIQDDGAVSTAIPFNPPPFSKASLTASLAVAGVGAAYATKKLVNRFRRNDG
ncbi:hypothetical protein [Glycomyces sp. YM15]|uniref:hypothetical protein n=1 Tax=Glycomyces sp. YM15 TaxID=2800446 RepID=UPI001962F051|nr:hypothetical protein [Glycomyces sp. YM15]